MNARGIPPELELLEALEALEALGLVDVEENDLGELRVSPTRAGIDAVRDGDEAAPARADAVRRCPECLGVPCDCDDPDWDVDEPPATVED